LATFPNNGFIIVAEFPITWQDSMPEEPPAGFNPVFLSDAKGNKAAIFIRCGRCGASCGTGPTSDNEEADWNSDPPKVAAMVACGGCQGFYLITREKAWQLLAIPTPQPQHRMTTNVQVPPL